jgi:hypothetical protein
MRSKVKQARGRIETLRLALLGPCPEEIAAALPGLEEAARCFEDLARQGGMEELRADLQLLKNDLRIVTRLIEHGVTFCRGWAKLLGASPAYTQAGQAVPLESSPGGRTLSLRG